MGRMFGDTMQPRSGDVLMEVENGMLLGRYVVVDYGNRVSWGKRFDLGNNDLLE